MSQAKQKKSPNALVSFRCGGSIEGQRLGRRENDAEASQLPIGPLQLAHVTHGAEVLRVHQRLAEPLPLLLASAVAGGS